MIILCGRSQKLNFFAVGNRRGHGPQLRLIHTIDPVWIIRLSGNQPHPGICRCPVIWEIIKELHCITGLKGLLIDRSIISCNEVGACAVCLSRCAVISIEYQAAITSGHTVLREVQIILPFGSMRIIRKLAVHISLHFQVIVIAGLVLNHQSGLSNGTFRVLLSKFPIRNYIFGIQNLLGRGLLPFCIR